jgi:hypothetical protein
MNKLFPQPGLLPYVEPSPQWPAADFSLLLQVEAWRARGRVPLGVDITASLLETALCDPTFWGPAAASAAVAAAANLQGTASVATGSISQQQIRLQYSATIVR